MISWPSVLSSSSIELGKYYGVRYWKSYQEAHLLRITSFENQDPRIFNNEGRANAKFFLKRFMTQTLSFKFTYDLE